MRLAAPPPAPPPATVWVWQIDLVQPVAVVQQAARLLSADEQARAARFYFARDRDRFVLARAALRQILGRCLAADPAALAFAYSPAGKPTLSAAAGTQAGPTLHFNLSHSHTLALAAVTRGAHVGVDVEHQRDLPELASIARRFFSPRESERLLGLTPAEQPAAFFRCWTRKEAYLKGRGTGIVGGLDRFDVSFAPGEAPALLRTLDDPAEAARWSLHDLAPAAGYAGALAVAAPTAHVVVAPWQFGPRNF